MNQSADLAVFLKKSEKSRIFQHPFGNPAPNRGGKLYDRDCYPKFSTELNIRIGIVQKKKKE